MAKDASSVQTFKACLTALTDSPADWFLLENLDLDDSGEESNLSIILSSLQECGPGYKVQQFKMISSDFGIPQRRVRLFFLGYNSRRHPDVSFSRVEKRLAFLKLKTQPPVSISVCPWSMEGRLWCSRSTVVV